MSDNNWQEKTVSERLQWYRNEIDSLFKYLSNKEPFSQEHAGYATTISKEIKSRMQADIYSTTDNADLTYYGDAVKRAFEELNKLEEDLSNWHDSLGRTNDILVAYKSSKL